MSIIKLNGTNINGKQVWPKRTPEQLRERADIGDAIQDEQDLAEFSAGLAAEKAKVAAEKQK